jgi:hypothetical protein
MDNSPNDDEFITRPPPTAKTRPEREAIKRKENAVTARSNANYRKIEISELLATDISKSKKISLLAELDKLNKLIVKCDLIIEGN